MKISNNLYVSQDSQLTCAYNNLDYCLAIKSKKNYKNLFYLQNSTLII